MENKSGEYGLFKMSFVDDKLPMFKEVQGKDWVLNGETNTYPDYLIDLFNRSGKHNAIVTGVAQMIVGNGFKTETPSIEMAKFMEYPNPFESLNDILNKVALDLKLFGGFYLQCVWSRDGSKIVEMYHIPFREMRVDKSGSKFYKAEKWGLGNIKTDVFEKFNPADSKGQAQIFYYKEYRPDLKFYPLPDYIGVQQYITIDTEISNFHYNNIKSNFSVGKIVSFFNGVPTLEEQKAIERKIMKKHTGTDNAGGFILNFADRKDQAPEIVNLQPDEMDKQYLQLYNTVSDEIFIGHRITNPSIFGVKIAGQLGSRQDLIDSKEVFYADYVKGKVAIIERVFNYLMKWIVVGGTLVIEKGDSQDTTGQTKVAMAKQLTQDDVLMMFEECGVPASDYRVIKSKRLRFGDEVENEDRFKEDFLYDFEFAEPINIEINDLQAKVLSIIKENPQLTTAEISNIGKIDVPEVVKVIEYLTENGVLKVEDSTGKIKITDRGLKTIDENNLIATEIFVKYKYDGTLIPTSRPFCMRMVNANKLYTRAEIDNVSEKAGYNVWTQRGGWYHNPDGVNTPYCRHFWNQVIVKKKTR